MLTAQFDNVPGATGCSFTCEDIIVSTKDFLIAYNNQQEFYLQITGPRTRNGWKQQSDKGEFSFLVATKIKRSNKTRVAQQFCPLGDDNWALTGKSLMGQHAYLQRLTCKGIGVRETTKKVGLLFSVGRYWRMTRANNFELKPRPDVLITGSYVFKSLCNDQGKCRIVRCYVNEGGRLTQDFRWLISSRPDNSTNKNIERRHHRKWYRFLTAQCSWWKTKFATQEDDELSQREGLGSQAKNLHNLLDKSGLHFKDRKDYMNNGKSAEGNPQEGEEQDSSARRWLLNRLAFAEGLRVSSRRRVLNRLVDSERMFS